MGNILNSGSNQQTVRIMTSQPALAPTRTINSQQHRIVSVSISFNFDFIQSSQFYISEFNVKDLAYNITEFHYIFMYLIILLLLGSGSK